MVEWVLPPIKFRQAGFEGGMPTRREYMVSLASLR
jgi:hypothetical protein